MASDGDNLEEELKGKSIRELLLISAIEGRHMRRDQQKVNDVLFNDGWGLVAQVKVLWGASVILTGALTTIIVAMVTK
jgi:hypothetical protein